ncbi:MAG TPA: hypothetical protein VMF61_14760 [Candidatus Acidoferrales bacterium]|nr:hypothetical protein [Candidatus Acidoferrales bacterium]
MTPDDEVVFLRATNEVEFRIGRIERLQYHKPAVDAGIEPNPLIVFDVGTLPRQIERFMRAGTTLNQLAHRYPYDARLLKATQQWEAYRRAFFPQPEDRLEPLADA